jgi:putative transcriptional regulator
MLHILTPVKALSPGFLIAMPQMMDPNFQQTVVLVVEHSAEGSMGLVLNRESPLTLGELAKNQDLQVWPGRSAQRVHVGGPVEPYRGFVLHDSSEVEERTEVLPGLFLSVTSDALTPLLVDARAHLRFCLGYAGWGPGQVERELKEGAWLFTEATRAPALTAEPGELWQQVIKGMGIDPGWLVTSGGLN